MTFAELGLRPELLRAIEGAGYTTPTPIQESAIPVALAGQDVLGCAQTGTGKTAVFLWPILQHLASGARGRVRALVVTPTRELAAQIGERAQVYGRHLPVRSTTVFGGVGMSPQIAALRRGAELVIATPGRLLDHVERRTISLAGVEILVLDEADRMLDMGFLPDVRRILSRLPDRRQNLFFSATMPAEIESLIQRTMRTPVVVEVTRRASTGGAVRQVVHAVASEDKRDLLCHLLGRSEMGQVLVFTRTKARADRLARHLQKTGRKVAAIHGDKSQGARTSALDGFRRGRIDTLVATDIAARGIDVEDISHVVNFDLPHVAEDYVHRIGRTARAGASGDAISLVSAEERGLMAAIERLIGRSIPHEAVPGFSPRPAAASAPAPAPASHRAMAAPRTRPLGGAAVRHALPGPRQAAAARAPAGPSWRGRRRP